MRRKRFPGIDNNQQKSRTGRKHSCTAFLGRKTYLHRKGYASPGSKSTAASLEVIMRTGLDLSISSASF